MKLFLIAFLNLFTIFISGNTFSQDIINTMDGQQISANKIYEDTSSILLRYDILNKKGTKHKTIDKLEIFSIDYQDKSQKIIYRKDSALGYPLATEEMSNYILGEQQARKNFKAPWVTVGGTIIGGITGYYVGFWALASSVVYGTGMGLIGPKVKTSETFNTDLKSDKHFIAGFKDQATRKKVKNAILGTALGIVVFGVTSVIYNLK